MAVTVPTVPPACSTRVPTPPAAAGSPEPLRTSTVPSESTAGVLHPGGVGTGAAVVVGVAGGVGVTGAVVSTVGG